MHGSQSHTGRTLEFEMGEVGHAEGDECQSPRRSLATRSLLLRLTEVLAVPVSGEQAGQPQKTAPRPVGI
jgi:hypothetical protein